MSNANENSRRSRFLPPALATLAVLIVVTAAVVVFLPIPNVKVTSMPPIKGLPTFAETMKKNNLN